MSRLVIHNRTALPDHIAVSAVLAVMRQGMISEDSKGGLYCYVSEMKSGHMVSCRRSSNGFTFWFCRPEGGTK